MKDIMNNTTAEVPIPLGQTLITARARETLHPQEVLSALWQHAHEQWGDCFDADDARKPGLREDLRLVSNHVSSHGKAFQIATESERDLTTVLLRDETDLSHAGLVEDWVCNLGCPNCGG
jgi:hypothetical protein